MLDCLMHDQIVTKWMKLGLEGMPICYHHVSVIIYIVNKVIVQILTWTERAEAFQCCLRKTWTNPDYSSKGVKLTTLGWVTVFQILFHWAIANSLEHYNPLNKVHGQASYEFRLWLSYHIETRLKLWKWLHSCLSWKINLNLPPWIRPLLTSCWSSSSPW